MKTLSIFFTSAALFCGCQTAQLNTPSGANEVTVVAPLPLVKNELASEVSNRGYSITRSDDFVIEAEKNAGVMASVLLAPQNNPTTYKVARFNLMQTPSGVRVILHMFIIAGGRDLGEVTGGSDSAQQWLQTFKTNCEKLAPVQK
jgi:hypothetical protein